MNANIRAALLLLVLLAGTAAGTADAQPGPRGSSASDLSWMVGEWVQCGRGGAVTEEHWVGSGTALVGLNWSRSASGRISWEHLRVGIADRVVTYFASPEGAPATPFAMTSLQPNAVVFENAGHEFPKRISYRRDRDQLVAQATDLAGRGPVWTFRRKVAGQACSALPPRRN
jgi:hypothetical protein